MRGWGFPFLRRNSRLLSFRQPRAVRGANRNVDYFALASLFSFPANHFFTLRYYNTFTQKSPAFAGLFRQTESTSQEVLFLFHTGRVRFWLQTHILIQVVYGCIRVSYRSQRLHFSSKGCKCRVLPRTSTATPVADIWRNQALIRKRCNAFWDTATPALL